MEDLKFGWQHYLLYKTPSLALKTHALVSKAPVLARTISLTPATKKSTTWTSMGIAYVTQA